MCVHLLASISFLHRGRNEIPKYSLIQTIEFDRVTNLPYYKNKNARTPFANRKKLSHSMHTFPLIVVRFLLLPKQRFVVKKEGNECRSNSSHANQPETRTEVAFRFPSRFRQNTNINVPGRCPINTDDLDKRKMPLLLPSETIFIKIRNTINAIKSSGCSQVPMLKNTFVASSHSTYKSRAHTYTRTIRTNRPARAHLTRTKHGIYNHRQLSLIS